MKPEAPDFNTDSDWEAAYLRFETPDQETLKFVHRLRKLGADSWDRRAEVVELFCGRGNGLHALQQLGFLHIEGVDLSAALAARYKGGGHIYTADCRKLPFAASSRDIAIVQGGLHHLLSLQDLEMVMTEIDRVLRPNGFFVTVEPWRTPFLSLVHILCGIGLVRRISSRFDALAVMINHERPTYEAWLRQPETILSILKSRFKMQRCFIRWGKIVFVGMKK